jgi:hypothetical protein
MSKEAYRDGTTAAVKGQCSSIFQPEYVGVFCTSKNRVVKITRSSSEVVL